MKYSQAQVLKALQIVVKLLKGRQTPSPIAKAGRVGINADTPMTPSDVKKLLSARGFYVKTADNSSNYSLASKEFRGSGEILVRFAPRRFNPDFFELSIVFIGI